MFAGILSCYVVLALALHILTSVLVGVRLFRRTPAYRGDSADLPFVSQVRPLCGLEKFSRETLGSSFTQDYPRFEVLFCVASDKDPVLPLVRELAETHPDVNARVLVGEDIIGQNPKLNNMAKGYWAGGGDWVCFTDSNVLMPPDYLRRLAIEWREGMGVLSSPCHGICVGNFWGAVEAAFLNTHSARLLLALDSLGLGLSQGKTLFMPREVIERGGGIEALASDMAEDAAVSKMVLAQGLRPRFTRRTFPQPIGRRRAKDVWGRMLRWSRLRRDAFPQVFAVELLQGAVAATLAALCLHLFAGLPGAVPLAIPFLWFGAETVMARMAGWPAGPREIAAMAVREIMLPAIWIATWFGRRVVWQGTVIAPRASKSDTG